MKIRSFLFAITLLGCCCDSAVADQLTLKNGDRLTGSVVRSDGKTEDRVIVTSRIHHPDLDKTICC